MTRSSLISWYRRLPSLPARFHIAFGLSSLVTSVVLLAAFTGFVPDREGALRAGRVALAEALASSSSMLLRRGDLAGIRDSLEFVVERNADLVAVALFRAMDDSTVIFSGDAASAAAADAAEAAAATALEDAGNGVVVPLYRGGRAWGELRFAFGGESSGWLARARRSPFALMAFIGLISLPLFHVYLGRMLKALDPSRAVPGRVRSALDTIAESLFVIDRHGTLVLANAAFADLVGRSAESLLGVPVASLDWVDDESTAADAAAPPWRRALDLGVATRQDMIAYVDAAGVRRRFIVNCSPVTGAKGKVGGVLVSMDDVTRLEEQEQLLRESMEAAEEASRAKSAFLSNMSHEIRTPMTAILGFTDVLRSARGQSEGERQRHLATISTSGRHLLGLINDLLDLSKVEQGAMEVESIPTEPVGVAAEVIEVLRVKAEEKDISLTLEVVDALPETVLSDPARLRQIVTNLVGNAIKFTERGGVVVRVGRRGEMLRMAIVDSGIGMSEAQQASIFDAFAQADVSITRRFGGTGLGLSISRELARALGGDVTVSSVSGEGSTFLIEVPLGQVDGVPLLPAAELLSRAMRVERAAGESWRFADARVLVVDDAAENRELLALVLGDLGLDVSLACDGREAIDAVAAAEAAAVPFEAILMDIQMPGMDGYEAVGRLRASGFVAPVIALTANAMKGFESRVEEAGFSHYQTKPIDIAGLGRLLGELLGGERTVTEAADEAVHGITNASESSNRSAPAVATEETDPLVSSLLAGSPKFHEIVARFMPRLDEETVALRAALEAGKMEDVARIAHWLKGSAGNVGFDDFTAPAERLERCAQSADAAGVAREVACVEGLVERVRSGWTDELPAVRSA